VPAGTCFRFKTSQTLSFQILNDVDIALASVKPFDVLARQINHIAVGYAAVALGLENLSKMAPFGRFNGNKTIVISIGAP
jgi:hypothetical protein